MMGFGMRKIDYTRKPRKYMSELKRIYGEQLDAYLETKIRKGELHEYELTEAERYAIRRRIQKELRRDNQKRVIAIILAIAIVAGVILGLKYLIQIPLY